MPIYAYKCASCGHARDVLQKLSDVPLTVCPACGAESFSKQVTAAGFQLKGSGWYATDFRNGSSPPAADKAAGKAADGAASTSAEARPAESKPDSPKPAEGGGTKTDAPAASAGASL